MEDAHVRRSGAHAADDNDSRDDVWRALEARVQRMALTVVADEPPPLRGIPESSGASATRPTSAQAAFSRSLRALGDLDLAEVHLDLELDADPRQLGDGWSRIAAGIQPAFGIPHVITAEPAYARAVDWMLCAALRTVEPSSSTSYYFRVSQRPLNQGPFEAAAERLGDAVLRRQVVTGAYRLVSGTTGRRPRVQLAAVGSTIPEALEAAEELEAQGVGADVVDVVSADAVFAAWQRTTMRAVRSGTTPSIAGTLRQAFDFDVPLVTVHDQSAATLAWLGSALGVATVTVGPAIGDSRASHAAPVDTPTIVSAALAALSF